MKLPAILDVVPPLQTGRRRIYIGLSNEAIPAAAAALQFKDASGLWLASGVAGLSKLSAMKALDCAIDVRPEAMPPISQSAHAKQQKGNICRASPVEVPALCCCCCCILFISSR